MKKQRGGLKLKNPNKKGFTPIFDMINSASFSANLLSDDSLKGFMIDINVSEDDSEYFSMQDGKFRQPVTSFILKIVVTTETKNKILDSYKNLLKASESEDSCFEEAALQQKIWKSSISGGRPEICPSVANFSLFEKDSALNLLRFLRSKTEGDVKNVLEYLSGQLLGNRNYGICIIAMPKVKNSIKFADFIDSPLNTNFYGLTINTESINNAYYAVLANIARLFIDFGVIYFDLNSNNFLIFKTSDNQINSLIIDLVKVSDLNSGFNDDYLRYTEKLKILKQKNAFYNRIFTIFPNSPETEKISYMTDIINTINGLGYQSDWYENLQKNPIIMVNAFDLLKKSVETTETCSILPKTIKMYENSGFLINFDTDIDAFLVKFDKQKIPFVIPKYERKNARQKNPNCDNELPGMCAISGGKKRTRKIKKNRRSIKIKKSRKRIY